MDIKQIAHQVTKSLVRNSPSILTGLGLTGFVTAMVMAVKATPKAVEVLEDEIWAIYEEETDGQNLGFSLWLEQKGVSYNDKDYYDQLSLLPIQRKFEITWRYYVPASAMAILSGSAILFANHINLQRNATLVSLYTLAETGLREYQDKVVDLVGEKKERKVREELAQERINKHPLAEDDPRLLALDDGKELCFEELSSRYFRHDVESLRQIQNDYNERLLSEMSLSLNELYSDMDLETTVLGDKVGWAIEKGKLEFEFYPKFGPKGKPCVGVRFANPPQPLWF